MELLFLVAAGCGLVVLCTGCDIDPAEKFLSRSAGYAACRIAGTCSGRLTQSGFFSLYSHRSEMQQEPQRGLRAMQV